MLDRYTDTMLLHHLMFSHDGTLRDKPIRDQDVGFPLVYLDILSYRGYVNIKLGLVHLTKTGEQLAMEYEP